jgi:exocyst complex protein 7
MLGSGGQGVLDRGIREARARYMDVWQELLALLAESTNTGAVARLTGASGDKQVVKDSLSNFFARLDELEALSRQHPLSRQDPDLRDRLSQDVRKLVTPAFSAYAARHAKRVEKCKCSFIVSISEFLSLVIDARSSPADVENRITTMIA